MESNFTTANDNGSLPHSEAVLTRAQSLRWQSTAHDGAGIFVSKYSPVRTGASIQKTHDTANTPAPVNTASAPRKRKRTKPRHTSRFPVYALLLLWLVMVASIARFAGGPADATLVGESLAWAGGGLGLLSVALASLAKQRRAKLSHSIGISGASICFAGLFWFGLQKTGISIPLEFLAFGLAAASLGLSWIGRTPYLLHISLFLAIGWTGYSFVNAQASELAWLFPALWSMQMFLALDFHIKRSIALSILAGLLWVAANGFLLL